MLDDLLPLLAALTVAAVVYGLREARRRRLRVSPPMPGLTMQEAWERWLGGARHNLDDIFVPPGAAPDETPPRLRAEVGKSLMEIERRCAEADNPRAALRRAILHGAVIALHLEAVSALGEPERKALLQGYEEGMDELLRDAWRASTLTWIVLRQYGRLKYDDATASDWFHQFMHVARPYVREKVRMAREFVLQMDEGSGRFVEIYDELLQQLREEMLKARPKKRFVAPDLP